MGELFIYEKAFKFAKRIVKLHRYLTEEKREYVLSKQLLRSGTSIGANIKEARFAQSDKDYLSKLSIALKEANETEYWIELLNEGYLSLKESDSLLTDAREIIAILVTATKSVKEKIAKSKLK